MKDNVTASFLDKTDWRITLHRKLEACVDAEGTEWYPQRVKSLVSAASAEYPGWNAKLDIETEIDRLNKIYEDSWMVWFKSNLTKRRWQKWSYRRNLYMSYCHDVFEFIKNMCARKRMLLWGSKQIGGGTQMED